MSNNLNDTYKEIIEFGGLNLYSMRFYMYPKLLRSATYFEKCNISQNHFTPSHYDLDWPKI